MHTLQPKFAYSTETANVFKVIYRIVILLFIALIYWKLVYSTGKKLSMHAARGIARGKFFAGGHRPVQHPQAHVLQAHSRVPVQAPRRVPVQGPQAYRRRPVVDQDDYDDDWWNGEDEDYQSKDFDEDYDYDDGEDDLVFQNARHHAPARRDSLQKREGAGLTRGLQQEPLHDGLEKAVDKAMPVNAPVVQPATQEETSKGEEVKQTEEVEEKREEKVEVKKESTEETSGV